MRSKLFNNEGECLISFPDQCNGMAINSCQNGGQLVIEDSGCFCECTDDYSGSTCETRGRQNHKKGLLVIT